MDAIRRWRDGRGDRRRQAEAEWTAFGEAMERARHRREGDVPPGVRYQPRRGHDRPADHAGRRPLLSPTEPGRADSAA